MADIDTSLYGFQMTSKDRRRKPQRKYEDIKMLWQRQHEMLGLYLSGMSQKEVADRLGVTPYSVSMAVNSELGQKKISEMREKRDEDYIDVSKKIAELSEKALAVYEEIFDSDTISYNLKKSTSDTVLMDLGGHRSPTKIDSRSVNLTASIDELEEFKQAGLRAAKESGFLIDLPEGETIDAN